MTGSAEPVVMSWDERYLGRLPAGEVSELVRAACDLGPAPGRALVLACGMSAAPRALAAAGYSVEALDTSRVAVETMRAECKADAAAGGGTVEYRVADVETVELPPLRYRLVVGEKYWSGPVFDRAAGATEVGGLLVWSSLDAPPPGRSARWVPAPGEPSGRLPGSFDVLLDDVPSAGAHRLRRLIARRREAW
jgi:SAM-dependent methyltransferase